MLRSLLTGAILFVGTALALAQEETPDVDEIARRMSNPTLPMMNITTLFDYNKFTGDLPGASDQSAFSILLQPPIPIPLGSGASLIIRPAIPILFNQPIVDSMGTGWKSAGVNLGDIGADILYGVNKPSGLMYGFGAIASIPAATSEALRGEWAVGPSALIGIMKPWGVGLLLINQRFDVSGENKTSQLGGQYALAKSLPGGWQLVSNPPFTYNWDTKDFTFPIGAGPFRTILMGSTPVKLGLQFYYYLAQADAFGPQYLIRFQVQPSVRRPW